jgi:hypothetical protein
MEIELQNINHTAWSAENLIRKSAVPSGKKKSFF